MAEEVMKFTHGQFHPECYWKLEQQKKESK